MKKSRRRKVEEMGRKEGGCEDGERMERIRRGQGAVLGGLQGWEWQNGSKGTSKTIRSDSAREKRKEVASFKD